MFEDEDDATRYALLLEAQDFPSPSVESIDHQEIEEFCQGSGYHCHLVPQGFVPQSDAERLLLAPPDRNVEDLEWQAEEAEEAPIANDELEKIRKRLEGLL
jgi:hypothetical protein